MGKRLTHFQMQYYKLQNTCKKNLLNELLMARSLVIFHFSSMYLCVFLVFFYMDFFLVFFIWMRCASRIEPSACLSVCLSMNFGNAHEPQQMVTGGIVTQDFSSHNSELPREGIHSHGTSLTSGISYPLKPRQQKVLQHSKEDMTIGILGSQTS